ncbi:hypothetical protein BU15DRAFT_64656 [Melanogaster broomeanus]|nr:hypothetical protein BU15DRAFT_64656 [Melanogaster broomeanus]
MDRSSSANTVREIIETGGAVITALVKYSASVKNANESCQRLIQEIRLINSLASTAEAYVRTLSIYTVPDNFCRCWTDPKSPAMLYKSELDKVRENLEGVWLSQKHDAGWMKCLKMRQGRSIKNSEINAAIESFERFINLFNPVFTASLKNADALNAISRQPALFDDKRPGDKLREMYKWMDAVECTTKHETTLLQRQDETCKWLFDSRAYVHWCSCQKGFLRLSGKPGSGKSVLASTVIQNLSKTAADGTVLAYFYCDFRTERSTHAFEIIRSLLTQLLQKYKDNWLPLFDDLVNRESNGAMPPVDLDILYKLLLKAVQLHHQPVLVIDALDECNDHVKLTDLLARLHYGASCRVFVTSRPFPHASKSFSDLPTIDLHDMSAEILCDMKLHVEKEVAKCEKLASLRDEIVPSLLEKADGMFRWVQCQLDRLSDCYSESDLHDVLATFPSGLCETYYRILSDIDKKECDRKVVKSTLLWLVGALKPLRLHALIQAVSFDMQDEFLFGGEILNVCRGLVSYNKTDGVVSLSHSSVKEFFDRHLITGALSQYHLSSPIVNIHLAKLCIDYFRTPQMVPQFHICLIRWGDASTLGDVATLGSYMADFGSQHFRRVGETEEALHELMQSMLKLCDAFRAHSINSDIMLKFIVSFGTPCLLKMYLQHPQTVRLMHISNRNSPLVDAIAHNNYACVESLLNLGLDIKLLCSSLYYELIYAINPIHPLEAAVIAGNSRIVDLLLNRHCFIPQDIIHLAIKFSSTNDSSIISSLLKYGASTTVSMASGDSPLHAWLCGWPSDLIVQHDIAKELIDAGCDPRSKNATGVTPLIFALRSHNEALIDYLLGQGALFDDCGYIHLVDIRWARPLSWYDSAVEAARVSTHAKVWGYPITLADVFRVRMILQKRFKIPPLILGIILDLAEYWAWHDAASGYKYNKNSNVTFQFLRSPRTVIVQQIEFTARAMDESFAPVMTPKDTLNLRGVVGQCDDPTRNLHVQFTLMQRGENGVQSTYYTQRNRFPTHDGARFSGITCARAMGVRTGECLPLLHPSYVGAHLGVTSRPDDKPNLISARDILA